MKLNIGFNINDSVICSIASATNVISGIKNTVKLSSVNDIPVPIACAKTMFVTSNENPPKNSAAIQAPATPAAYNKVTAAIFQMHFETTTASVYYCE